MAVQVAPVSTPEDDKRRNWGGFTKDDFAQMPGFVDYDSPQAAANAKNSWLAQERGKGRNINDAFQETLADGGVRDVNPFSEVPGAGGPRTRFNTFRAANQVQGDEKNPGRSLLRFVDELAGKRGEEWRNWTSQQIQQGQNFAAQQNALSATMNFMTTYGAIKSR
jgi:hypothetical protein